MHSEHGVALKTIPWNTGETSQLFSLQAQYLYFFSICVCGYCIQLFQYNLSEISVKVHMTTHKVTMGRSRHRHLLHGLNTLSDITWQKSFLTLPFCSASFHHTKLKMNSTKPLVTVKEKPLKSDLMTGKSNVSLLISNTSPAKM